MRALIIVMLVFCSCSHSEQKIFYQNGNIKSRCKLDISGFKNGICKGYYINGSLKYISTYKNDKLEGECILFYSNGKKRKWLSFHNGNIDGRIEYYDSLENLYFSAEVSDDKLNGSAFSFFQEGSVAGKFSFWENKPIGIHEKFYENGMLKVRVRYDSSGLVKSLEEFDSAGTKLYDYLNLDFKIVGKKGGVYDLSITSNNIQGDFLGVVIGKFNKNKDELIDTLGMYSGEPHTLSFMYDPHDLNNSFVLEGVAYDLKNINGTENRTIIKNIRKFRFDLLTLNLLDEKSNNSTEHVLDYTIEKTKRSVLAEFDLIDE